jgi:hypothetical protein
MSPSVVDPPRFRHTLGQLMVLNVFLAILLAALVYAIKMGAGDANGVARALLVLTLGLPVALEVATMLLLGPGPRRDGLMALVKVLPVLLMTSATTLFAWSEIRNATLLGPGFKNPGFRLTLIVTCLAFWAGFIIYARSLFPRRCPSCGWRCLVLPRSGMKDTHVQCNLFEYAWCMACGARWKRRRPATKRWVDASDPAEDSFFHPGIDHYRRFRMAMDQHRRILAEAWRSRKRP